MVSIIKVLNIIRGDDQQKIAAIGTSLLSQKAEEVQAVSNDLPLVVFRLGPEAFGLRLHEVREIIMVGLITPCPVPHPSSKAC